MYIYIPLSFIISVYYVVHYKQYKVISYWKFSTGRGGDSPNERRNHSRSSVALSGFKRDHHRPCAGSGSRTEQPAIR